MILLSDFVKDALLDIFNGVKEAQNVLKEETNCELDRNPIAPRFKVGGGGISDDFREVMFEISTIVKDVGKKGGKINGQIYVVGIGGEYEKIKENEKITKIKFSVPVLFSALKKPK